MGQANFAYIMCVNNYKILQNTDRQTHSTALCIVYVDPHTAPNLWRLTPLQLGNL